MRFRNKSIIVVIILTSIALSGFILTKINLNPSKENSKKLKVVTSFYPVYIAALNIVDDIQNVELTNLTEPQTGCLHDYQLTPNDMIKLESADILIINGGGMESFIEDIVNQYPNLNIINSTDNIDFLKQEGYSHFESNEHNHSDNNAHVWISIDRYIKQINNIKNGLIKYDKRNETNYIKNSDTYISKLESLKIQMQQEMRDIKARDIIIFHDSFAYLADEFNLNIKYTVMMEDETSLSAKEVAEIIGKIKEDNIKVLFTEEQYSNQIAKSIASETDSNVYILDSGVSGNIDKDSYIKAMKKNLEVMKGALK